MVSIAILEQDLFAAVENVSLMLEEAGKLGMKAFAVASRWGGLVAGSPKVPSLSSKNPTAPWPSSRGTSAAGAGELWPILSPLR